MWSAYQRCKQEAWNPLAALKYLFLKNSTLNVERFTTILRDYQARLMSEPKQLISELLTLDTQQFLVAMKLLFSGRKEQTPLMDIDFDLIKAALVQSPGGNRSLFWIAKERCWSELNAPDCVELLGGSMRLSSGEFIHEELITDLPRDLQDYTFRNITAIFKDLYDKFSVRTQRAIYKWITLGLQKWTKSNEGFGSWVTAESLRFLGRYIVHLPVYNIKTIPLSEIRMFINYDNATKQLDSVYDVKHATAKAFLGRINGSGFDMGNTSIVYRLGLLVCFYNNVHLLSSSDARNLLHQLIKCNQLRGSQSDVQKLKSQLLEIVMKNQTLNETLGSVSDAVVGLTPSQLESLSPQAVQGSIAVLQQVLGWTRSQTIILAHKYVGSSKVLSFSNISQLGSLILGVDKNLFYSVSTEELGKALESTLSQYTSDLNPVQQHAIVSQMITAPELWMVMKQIPSVLFAEVSMSTLLGLQSIETSTVGEKQLTRSQIHEMDSKAFTTNFTLFEKNFHLLSPFQMNCLAWKYWEVLNTTNTSIPPILLSVLPLALLSADCDAVRAPTADDIRKLSEANLYWSAPELQCMSDDTFTRTVELLGSVEGYNMSQLRALKNKAKRVWGPLSSWKSYHVISLGAIGLALTESEIKELNLSSIDTVTALSQQSTWTAGQMNSLLTRFLEVSGLTLGALKGSDLAGLGIILCGVDPSQIQLISSAAYSATAARIGTLPCPADVLQELKKKAESLFGEVGNWNCSVLQEVGTIAAGLSKEELKAISKDLMPYFQPQAIAAIPPENFKIAELSWEQIQSLQASLNGLRESYASWGSSGSSTVNMGKHVSRRRLDSGHQGCRRGETLENCVYPLLI
ncbi:UNVERIFIED_CONTAM: hypothetical protein FKN15_068648 [Acipenser sinensis]